MNEKTIKGDLSYVASKISELSNTYQKYHFTDLVVDMEFLADEYYTSTAFEKTFFYSIGVHGTWILPISEREAIESVNRNYPNNYTCTIILITVEGEKNNVQ